MPRYDVRQYHEALVAASPERALAVLLALPAAEDPIIAALFRVRGISGGELPLRAFIDRLGFHRIASTDRSFIGTWEVAGVRIGIAVWSEPHGTRTARLATETRVLSLSAAARVGFRLYWLLVGPFSALIRRRWLAAAKRLAERPVSV